MRIEKDIYRSLHVLSSIAIGLAGNRLTKDVNTPAAAPWPETRGSTSRESQSDPTLRKRATTADNSVRGWNGWLGLDLFAKQVEICFSWTAKEHRWTQNDGCTVVYDSMI